MTCYISVPCPRRSPMTLAECLEEAGYEPAAGELLALQQRELMPIDGGPTIMCGKIDDWKHCPCVHNSDFLCDYPVGRGKTCDLPLCYCCREHVGEELDLCLIHFAEFQKKSGRETVNPWPPPRPPPPPVNPGPPKDLQRKGRTR